MFIFEKPRRETHEKRPQHSRQSPATPATDASKLNRSEGTIKTHLSLAHRQLRDMLRPYLQNEPLHWYRET